MDRGRRSNIALGIGLLLAILFMSTPLIIAIVLNTTAHKQKESQQNITKLEQQFLKEIERAKRETGDPCSPTFYAVITPPPGLTAPPCLVLMGQEIFSDRRDAPSERMWRMDYQLVPRGDRVELWRTEWMGTETLPPNSVMGILLNKLGEKFAPNNPQCKGK